MQRASSARGEDGLLPSLASRLAVVDLLYQLGLQATYFVGVVGCATYVLGANAFQVSYLVLTFNLVLVAGGVACGPFVDRVGPRRALVLAFPVMSLLGLFGWLFPLSMGSLFVTATLLGALWAVAGTAVNAFPRYLTESPRELLRMNGLCNTATSVAVIVGPLLGGAISKVAPQQCVFSVLAFAPLSAEAVVMGMPRAALCKPGTGETGKPDGAGRGGGRGAFLHELWEGVRIVFTHGDLAFLFFLGFLGFFCYGAFDSLESLFYRYTLHASSDWMGWLSAIAGVGGTLGSLLVMRVPERRLTPTLLSALLLVTGVGSMVYVGTGSVAVAAVGQAIVGLGFGAMGPVRTTLTQQRCDPSYVGRVTSVMEAGLNSAGIIPLFFAPFLADALGVQTVLFGASTMVALVAVAFLLASLRRR